MDQAMLPAGGFPQEAAGRAASHVPAEPAPGSSGPQQGDLGGSLGARSRAAGMRRLGVRLIGTVMGTADAYAVAEMASRELSLILRSRDWSRFSMMWLALATAVLLSALLYRGYTASWGHPNGAEWQAIGGYALQLGLGLLMAQWTVRRLRRDLYNHRLDELMLTRCSPADIAMGEALGSAVASLWLVVASIPICFLLCAIGGTGLIGALKLVLSLAPAGALGVWFGMGWGLAFTLRRSASIVSLSKWWFLGPFMPLWVGWSLLGLCAGLWPLMGFLPGGLQFARAVMSGMRWLLEQMVRGANPFLAPAAAAEIAHLPWWSNWLALCAITLFMLRKSTDAVYASLATLPERDVLNRGTEAWVHHDVHYFTQYGDDNRRLPRYYDGGNPIAAFDVALGHRVYFHPFLWTLLLLAYAFLLVWSLLVPAKGQITALVAVLIPATMSLLMMSGGVAVSFGWERDQHRWQSLAVLPISDYRLALGKIKGVVRPTLWLCLMASLTALIMGWRGAIEAESALWFSLLVLMFPVVLACVTAVITLRKRTLEEALYWWAVLGAIPTLATILPYPVGGVNGWSLPFTPPLLGLLLVVDGPTAELLRAAQISVTIQVLGLVAALLILASQLRRLTVGERD